MKGLEWVSPLGSRFRSLSSGRVHRDGMRRSVKNKCHLSLEALCEKCSLISSSLGPLAVHEAEGAEELLGFVLQVSGPPAKVMESGVWRGSCCYWRGSIRLGPRSLSSPTLESAPLQPAGPSRAIHADVWESL